MSADDDGLSKSPLGDRAARLSEARRALLERRLSAAPPAAAVLAPPSGAESDPFPLTEVQEAYWIGRDPELELGGVAAYGYAEYDLLDLDLERLEAAWNRLIKRHPALRTVVLPTGEQRFVTDVPHYSIELVDLCELPQEEARRRLDAKREELSHRVPRADMWPLFDVRATRLDRRRTRLHVGFDTLIADARSFELLATELDMLLDDPEAALPSIGVSFRECVLADRAREEGARERSRAYWFDRLDELPPAPELPLAADTGELRAPRFERHRAALDADSWRAVCMCARARRLTPSGVLLAAYAETLGCWSASPKFTLNLTLFHRPQLHPDVDRVVGCFTALSLLAIDLRVGATFADRAQLIQGQLWRDLEHRDVGAITVLREFRRRRGSSVAMPVVFTSALDTSSAQHTRLGEPGYAISQTPQVWIDCQVVERDGGVEVWWDTARDIFPPGIAGDMFAAYRELLGRLVDDQAWQSARPVGPPPRALEARSALEERVTWEGPLLLHELVDLGDRRRIAVTGAGGDCTAAALDERADRLAAALQARGARRNDLVAVAAPRGPNQIAAVLGILRSGAAYLPLDGTLPPERIATLLERSRAALVVTDRSTIELELPRGLERIAVDGDLRSARPAPVPQSSADLAYVMFTSGSTGTPKGVMMSHGAVANTLYDTRRRLRMDRADVILAVSDPSFDLSVFDIFGTLMAAATVVTPANGVAAKDPARWAELAERHRVTVWNSVPALMGMFVDHLEATCRRLETLRAVILSGDWIPVDLPERIRAVAPYAEVLSAGGATEAAIWSVAYPVPPTDPSWTSIPYGFPLVNQTARVRDTRGELPDWVPGELYIGGAGVATGYWDEPAATAERFVPDPAHPGARLYRTGDLARHRPGGVLEFLGRSDSQVKINGYRVDLAEVDTALARHPAVVSACSVVIGPRDGARQLHAFVVASDEVSSEEVRRHVASSLPSHMVPVSVERLEALPLTPNGKVDRKRLALRRQTASTTPDSPAGGARATGAERPRPVADVVAIAVSETLELTAPPRHDDDLLSLGADSVAIVRIGNRLQRLLGVTPRLESVYADPTPIGIAAECERQLVEHPGGLGPLATAATAQPGPLRSALRSHAPDAASVALAITDTALAEGRWVRSHSRRQPLGDPITTAGLGALLDPLRAITTPAGARRLYASAGALYPVRAYVAVKRDAVRELAPGVYYHDPVAHSLLAVGDGSPPRPEEFEPLVNRPIVARASFVVLLTVFMPAVEPAYSEHALRFATLEAGAIAQLLRDAAPAAGLALCAIGDTVPLGLATAAALEPGEGVMLMLAGGTLDPAETSATVEHPEPETFPMSAAQRRICVMERLLPERPDFNVPVALHASGEVDERALREALDVLVTRHAVLRTAFVFDGSSGVQRIVRTVPVPFEVREVPDLCAASDAAAEEARRPFDLSVPPAVRALLVRITPRQSVIVITFHHVACDETSLRLVLRELAALYAEQTEGERARLAEPERQYADYVEWERSADPHEVDNALAYWRRQLSGLPSAAARGGPPHGGGRIHAANVVAPVDVTAALVALATAERTTAFSVLLTAFMLALSTATGRADVTVGIPADDRRRVEFEHTVGSFVNTLVIRAMPTAERSFGEALARVGGTLRDALANAIVPYDRVVEALPDRSGADELYDAWLVVRAPTPRFAMPGLELSPLDLAATITAHSLKLDLVHDAHAITGKLIGRCDVWSVAATEGLAARTASLLAQAGAHAHRPLTELMSAADEVADAVIGEAQRKTDQSARERLRTARRQPSA